ncbi:tRNA (N6-threonylcarbamoyladenosine(37)-N6)-methyltransferase TrmO, partial [bacterium]|nr:tRNA (N6-threonylcarbamoyladenosine(37)-N6)-methyltransferase TrmO [candidate division CSSED10-310 bacterium]
AFGTGVEGAIELFGEYSEGLLDLDGFSHIIVIFHFHRAGPCRLRRASIWEERERGVFAIRAPSRPNPIGLSVVRLLEVQGTRLRIADLDMLDGTPVLDIKPYVPRIDDRRDATCGWLEDVWRQRDRGLAGGGVMG